VTRFSARRAGKVAVLVCAAISATAPAVARASTYTVDDDKADCPNAAFTSLQAAVNQAAPHDTLIVCPGTYLEGSTPTTNAASPAQAGSHNGLTIDKPLTIVGAGASKVLIEPNPAIAAGNSLAGTAPYLRDGGGNVITISRQSLGSTDADENFVSITGVTVASPTVYAEAGIAFFNTSGRIADSVIGPLTAGTGATQPYGYGVIETNSLQGGGLGTVRREVTVANSLITGYQAGGVLFDDATGIDGAATNTVRSGIIQYGYVDHTRIAGGGAGAAPPQTGVVYRAGQRGSVTSSEIVGNRAAGVLLADAETGPDPNNPAVRGFSALGDAFTGNGYGLLNEDATGTTVRTGAPASATSDWWGCAAGPLAGAPSDGASGCQGISGSDTGTPPAPSVEVAPFSTAAPAALSAPVTADAPPTATFVDPLDASTDAVGKELDPVVVANDDFGVKSVALFVNGTQVAVANSRPYTFSYTPTYADLGTLALKAVVTDSSNQTTTTTIHVAIPNPVGYQAATLAPSGWDAGTVLVGLTATQTFTVTDSGQNPITLNSPAVTGAGFTILPGGCSATTTLPVGGACTVTVQFAPQAEGPVSGALTVGYTAPGAVSPLTATLAGNGHIFQTSATGPVTGTVPATLALSLTSPSASFGSFTAGVAADYFTSLAATVTSSAGDAQLSIADPSATAPGHLVNGAFSLPQPLQAKATGAYAPVGTSASPLTLLSYAAPVSNSPVTIGFKQSIGATDALRTGSYGKTLVITLSTTTP
jgi:Bacterial Ig domain